MFQFACAEGWGQVSADVFPIFSAGIEDAFFQGPSQWHFLKQIENKSDFLILRWTFESMVPINIMLQLRYVNTVLDTMPLTCTLG